MSVFLDSFHAEISAFNPGELLKKVLLNILSNGFGQMIFQFV